MYICLCNGISDKDIEVAVSNGARTVSSVYGAHGCAPQCGKCACYIKQMLPSSAAVGDTSSRAVYKPSDI
ncbi:MAG: (2Fe-2S)-binding protein [Sneathiella sp.]